MGLGYKRSDLRANAEQKLADAILLLRSGSYSNAYYLAGYAVELGLKACIASRIAADTVPDKGLLTGFLSHEFGKLVGLAGLAGPLKSEMDGDAAFAANWAIVSEWSPDARYEAKDAMSAQIMVQALSDAQTGVLRWIRKFW